MLQWLLERVNASSTRQLSGFSRSAMDILVAYTWPGDIDEAIDLVGRYCFTSFFHSFSFFAVAPGNYTALLQP